MKEIYLCDDDNAVRCQIQTALERKILAENYDMKVAASVPTAQELLAGLERGRQGIYFLDVELKDGEWDGFQLGQELRRRDPQATLVYITSYGDLAWRTFQYHLEAFDYIVKGSEPVGPAATRCLEEIYNRLLSQRQAPGATFSAKRPSSSVTAPAACSVPRSSTTVAHSMAAPCSSTTRPVTGAVRAAESCEMAVASATMRRMMRFIRLPNNMRCCLFSSAKICKIICTLQYIVLRFNKY